MAKSTGRVIKADDVKVQGVFHLDNRQPARKPANLAGSAAAVPQVRVAEQTADFAVLEITCCCGTKMHVRCEYKDIKSN